MTALRLGSLYTGYGGLDLAVAAVLDVVPGLTRNQQLKALGNGVVWQQGAAALGILPRTLWEAS